jgi:nucleotide-binding universal stress UspA family protein
MMKPKRILVALSLSDGRDAAFERGLALAKSTGAELYLLHAIPADHPFSHRAAERLRRATELRARAEAAGVPALAVEQHGDPADIIVLHADDRAVDLIVMGTERRTGWARFRERSIAERVLRRTKRPTLVVRGDDASDFEKVLVAVDLSPASTTLVDSALQLLGGKARRLTVMHAVTGIEAADAVRHRGRWVVPEYRGYVLDAARERLADVMPASAGSDVSLEVAAGPAAETIGTYAADADLIVMGRSRRFMHLGSTAVRMLRTTDRALLIVPPEAAAQATDGMARRAA